MKRRVLHHYKIFLTLLGSQAWLLRIVQDHDNRISLQSSWVIVGHDDSRRQSPVAMRRRLSWFASNHWAIHTNIDWKISSRDLLLGEWSVLILLPRKRFVWSNKLKTTKIAPWVCDSYQRVSASIVFSLQAPNNKETTNQKAINKECGIRWRSNLLSTNWVTVTPRKLWGPRAKKVDSV